MMETWIPWTDLAPETRDFAGLVGANLFELADPSEGYGEFMVLRWRCGRPFAIVEHDVVPSSSDLDELERCERPLCFFGYEGEGRLSLMFGCIRFSAGFISASPSLWEDFIAARYAPEGHHDHDFSAERCRRWMMLPEWLDHATGSGAHFHGRVPHLARGAGAR